MPSAMRLSRKLALLFPDRAHIFEQAAAIYYNLPEPRKHQLGEYLVLHGACTPGELVQALAMPDSLIEDRPPTDKHLKAVLDRADNALDVAHDALRRVSND